MTVMTEYLRAEKLAMIRENRLLFKELSFVLHRGQVIHIQGENGSGKTTLLKLLAGIMTPTQGRVQYYTQKKPLYIGHENAIKPTLTVTENIYFNSMLFDGVRVNKQTLSAALQTLNLVHFADEPCVKLSAGQQRRVSLARLWTQGEGAESHSNIWLLDEPLTALDNEVAEAVQQRINILTAEEGSVILTSHQMLHLASSVKILQLGV